MPAHACITSRAEFLWETSNHPGDSAPLDPSFHTLWLVAFPKTKITFEREEISDLQWNSGKYIRLGRLWWLGELCEIPRCLLWRKLRCHWPVYNGPCVFFNKGFFHITWLDIFWTDLVCSDSGFLLLGLLLSFKEFVYFI